MSTRTTRVQGVRSPSPDQSNDAPAGLTLVLVLALGACSSARHPGLVNELLGGHWNLPGLGEIRTHPQQRRGGTRPQQRRGRM